MRSFCIGCFRLGQNSTPTHIVLKNASWIFRCCRFFDLLEPTLSKRYSWGILWRLWPKIVPVIHILFDFGKLSISDLQFKFNLASVTQYFGLIGGRLCLEYDHRSALFYFSKPFLESVYVVPGRLPPKETISLTCAKFNDLNKVKEDGTCDCDQSVSGQKDSSDSTRHG